MTTSPTDHCSCIGGEYHRGALAARVQEDSSLDTSNLAVYEQHFQQVAPEGADSCSVDLARQHFSSMLQVPRFTPCCLAHTPCLAACSCTRLGKCSAGAVVSPLFPGQANSPSAPYSRLQGEAFDAILERVSGPSAQLDKGQFLAITHLVHTTLEAAQNSDALWVEPEPAPGPTGKKKRHPTVEEVLGSRLVEAASSAVSLEDGEGCDPGMPSVDSKENRHVAANKAGPENSRVATPRDEQQQPGRQPATVPSSRRQSPRLPQPGSGDPGAADVTDFERKLQVQQPWMWRPPANSHLALVLMQQYCWARQPFLPQGFQAPPILTRGAAACARK